MIILHHFCFSGSISLYFHMIQIISQSYLNVYLKCFLIVVIVRHFKNITSYPNNNQVLASAFIRFFLENYKDIV